MALVIKTIVTDKLRQIYNPRTHQIDSIILFTVGGAPEKITEDKGVRSKQDVKQSVSIYDAVALIVKIVNPGDIEDVVEDRLVIAENVMIVKNHAGNLVAINGLFKVISDDDVKGFYSEDKELRTMTTEKIEDFLEINKSQSVAKIFSEISEYFTAENYQVNNNIFRLIRHKDKSLELAKKVLLKSIMAYQLEKGQE
ncbi:hypothetical protein EI74_0368 [Mycoplasma testudineum]|uniref:Uncharacterized protein n=1 Tax=Mycoplasma testudineum TaxID=244584 RepID=A0A4R6IES0_9MOLU|nr:hypothetical protein [Mycoplasma testudineum]OYD26986.1 hypothetical protein CG473_01465 [Mycoplasma testudineum]TDO20532.1 hypothetical protein EI74_0368 [Mycoplasma testudineum]